VTTVIPNVQLFVYYVDRVTPIAMLFLLQGVYQLYPANKKNKHTQFYIFSTIT